MDERRLLSLCACACASHHRFQKYGGLHEERTLAEGFRKGENEDKNDCYKTTSDTSEEINAGKDREARRNDSGLTQNKFVDNIVCTKPLRILYKRPA